MPEDSASAVRGETRRLAAIMVTDIVGFSRQMGADEARMLRLLEIHNQIIRQAVSEHHGTVIKTVGDAFLVDFPSVVNAVQCAQYIQAQFRAHNTDKETAEQIHVRIGIHLGDIVQKEGDVFGDGVNIASRLQALAEPDSICISDMVYRDVAKKLDVGTAVSLGRPKLKNIAGRFAVYTLLPEPPKGVRQTLQIQRRKLSRRVGTAHLGWVAVGLVLSAATVVVIRYLSPPSPSTQHLAPSTQAAPAALPLPDKPSIVVLPFDNMSKDPEQDYFSNGITEVLTSDLSRLSSLFVIARNTAFTYKGQATNVQAIRKELGVRYVLEGSVQRANDQVRIVAQLVDVTTDAHMWSERFDRPFKDIFALQDEIVQKIVFALKVKLTPEEQKRFQVAPTSNLAAYDFYLRGRESYFRALYETKKELNDQARQMCEKAIELDPEYAGAYAMLAWTYWNDYFNGWHDRAQSLAPAFELAQKAVALDDSLPGPHRVLGIVSLWNKQYQQAIAEAERAIALDPNNVEGYMSLGNILAFAGRPEEAIRMIEQAMRLDPRYLIVHLNSLGIAYRVAGRYEEALVPLKKLLTLNPDYVQAHINLAACYAELGWLEEARAEGAAILRINPQFSLEVASRNWPYKDPAQLERYLAALRKAGLK